MADPITLFSFGTLLDAKVQHQVFGGQLKASPATLSGVRIIDIPINDPDVIAVSGISVHRGLKRSIESTVTGGILALSSEQLAQADAYEVSDYVRRRVQLTSGDLAWAYLDSHPIKAAERIGVIGDSIAYGRSDITGGWAQHLKVAHCDSDEKRHRLWNFAIPGEKLTNLESYILPELVTRSVDTVLIGAGINDVIAGISANAILSALESLCEKLEDAGCRPVTFTPLWLDAEKTVRIFGADVDLVNVCNYRVALLDWGKRTHRDVVDLYPALENRSEILTDGIYPDARGHEIIFRSLYRS